MTANLETGSHKARVMRLSGGRHMVTCSDGMLLAARTAWPWLDACLALHSLGRWGRLELFDYVHPDPIRVGDIESSVDELRHGGRRPKGGSSEARVNGVRAQKMRKAA